MEAERRPRGLIHREEPYTCSRMRSTQLTYEILVDAYAMNPKPLEQYPEDARAQHFPFMRLPEEIQERMTKTLCYHYKDPLQRVQAVMRMGCFDPDGGPDKYRNRARRSTSV